MKIGFMELAVIFIVALIAIGPDKLPSFARKLGAAMREFRKVSSEVTQDMRENVIEPLEEAQKPIREAMEPLEELDKEVRQNLKDMEKDLKNIGKPAPKKPEPEPEPEPELSDVTPEDGPQPEEQIDENTGGENT